jgi:hypothetical protein
MNDLHFAADPDNMLCGRAAIDTLCGEQHHNTTNWAADQVTCTRCLEVMEERATGVTVTQVHDEVIISPDPWSLPGCEPEPKPYGKQAKKHRMIVHAEVNAILSAGSLPGCEPEPKPDGKQAMFQMWADEMLQAYKKQSVLAKMMKREAGADYFARVKKKSGDSFDF